MKSFQEWRDDIQEQIAGLPGGVAEPTPTVHHDKATKAQVLDYWRSLQPNRIIPMQPIPETHKGSTYSQDGIRVTGTRAFIDGVIGRLKDLIAMDNQTSKLDVVYREIEASNPQNARPETFVFYIMARQRPFKQPKAVAGIKPSEPKAPKIPKLTPPKLP
jgi:hypothetical protein